MFEVAGTSNRWDARAWTRRAVAVAVVLILLIAPLYVSEFYLRLGFGIAGAAIGAIGLNLLTGSTGQLSLAHAFFLAVGAFGYCYFSGTTQPGSFDGLGLPPAVGAVLAVILAAVVGLLVSPITNRLSGLYLGIATLALVYIGQEVFNSWKLVTGGFEGRPAPEFSLLGLRFSDSSGISVLGVPFGRNELLWYLGSALLCAVAYLAHNLLRSKYGRAFRMVRDHPLQAPVNGIDSRIIKLQTFTISAAMAGLSGVLFALFIGSVAPNSFTLDVSIQYLVMIVVGGLGDVFGAIIGAAIVTALPLLLQQYASSWFSFGGPSSAATFASYLYGAILVAVLLFLPGGLAGIHRQRRRKIPTSECGITAPDSNKDPKSQPITG